MRGILQCPHSRIAAVKGRKEAEKQGIFSSCFHGGAIGAVAVDHGARYVDGKLVVLPDMLADGMHDLAVEVDDLAAVEAFQVEMVVAFSRLGILIECALVGGVFFDQPFACEMGKATKDSCLADLDFGIFDDILCRKADVGVACKIGENLISLSGTVFFLCHKYSKFDIDYHIITKVPLLVKGKMINWVFTAPVTMSLIS